MFKRLFWLVVGLGAGVASAVMAGRFMKKQSQKIAPAHVAKVAGASFLDLGKRVSASIEEGRQASAEREREMRDTAKRD